MEDIVTIFYNKISLSIYYNFKKLFWKPSGLGAIFLIDTLKKLYNFLFDFILMSFWLLWSSILTRIESAANCSVHVLNSQTVDRPCVVSHDDVTVAVGGRRGWEAGEHTLIHTDSNRYREDGGRCGSGGADLQPAATSPLKAGEFSRSFGSNTAHRPPTPAAEDGDTEQETALWLLCCYWAVGMRCCRRSVCWLFEEWLGKKITARFRGNPILGFRSKETQHWRYVRGFVSGWSATARWVDMNETAHRGPVVGRCRVPSRLTTVNTHVWLSLF